MTLPSAITDRTGTEYARLTWAGNRLVEIEVAGANVSGTIVTDPLLGRAHEISAVNPDDPSAMHVVTTMSAIDWAHPNEIPAIAVPGALPHGVGGALMNVLAILAQRAGVTELRYAGPYPTNALWSTLARSFRTTATEAEFTAPFLDRAARIARDPMPAVFVPAPYERSTFASGHVEIRDGIERVMIDGVVYARGASIGRVVDGGGGTTRAEVWFGDTLYAHVATFAADGSLLEGPHAMPTCANTVVGKTFPRALCDGLADLLADTIPAALAMASHAIVKKRTLVWADLGPRAALRMGDSIAVHAVIWERVAPLGMARLALAIVEALCPIVTQIAAADVALMSTTARA